MASDLTFWERLADAAYALVSGVFWILASGFISGTFFVIALLSKRWGPFEKLRTPPGRDHVIWTIMLVGVSYSWFVAFDLANVENHRLVAELRGQSESELKIESEGTLFIDDYGQDRVHLALYARIVNLGTPAAVLGSSWKFTVRLPNNSLLVAAPATITRPECFPSRGLWQIFTSSDQLSLRASKPIDHMGYAIGVLTFDVRGANAREITNPNTRITVSVADVKENPYNVTFNVSEFLEHADEPVYRTEFLHPLLEPKCPSE